MDTMNQAVPHREVNSLSAYLRAVDAIWTGWARKRDYIPDIWFRGHADVRWQLLPGALRADCRHISEHRLRHDFLLRAQPFLHEATVPPVNDWDWYFLMQHFGLPTRLLDWSSSALVALFFAVQPPGDPKHPACVWVLDPRALNQTLSDLAYIPIYSDAWVARYLPRLWDEEAEIPLPALAIDPPHNSPRLAAQHGKFTVHGEADLALTAMRDVGPALVQLVVPAEFKGPILRQLLSAGMTEAVLFPGLSGLASELRHAYSVGFQV